MLEKLRIIFSIPELRQKILLTVFLLAIYRIGWQIPLPMIDQGAIVTLVKATVQALRQLRTKDEIATLRGVEL